MPECTSVELISFKHLSLWVLRSRASLFLQLFISVFFQIRTELMPRWGFLQSLIAFVNSNKIIVTQTIELRRTTASYYIYIYILLVKRMGFAHTYINKLIPHCSVMVTRAAISRHNVCDLGYFTVYHYELQGSTFFLYWKRLEYGFTEKKSLLCAKLCVTNPISFPSLYEVREIKSFW